MGTNRLSVHPAFYRRVRHYRDRISIKDGRPQVAVRFVRATQELVVQLLKNPGPALSQIQSQPESPGIGSRERLEMTVSWVEMAGDSHAREQVIDSHLNGSRRLSTTANRPKAGTSGGEQTSHNTLALQFFAIAQNRIGLLVIMVMIPFFEGCLVRVRPQSTSTKNLCLYL